MIETRCSANCRVRFDIDILSHLHILSRKQIRCLRKSELMINNYDGHDYQMFHLKGIDY